MKKYFINEAATRNNIVKRYSVTELMLSKDHHDFALLNA